MRVFVTGGTGTIGTPVVAELIGNGHTVLALARSDSSAQALRSAGAATLRGGLADRDVLLEGVAQSDGVISLAFTPDYDSSEGLTRAIAEESAALTTLGEALAGSDRPIVAVSGTPWTVGPRFHRSGPTLDGWPGGRSRAIPDRAARAGLPRRSEHRGPPSSNGAQPGHRRVRRSVDQPGTPDGCGWLPGDGAQRWPAVHALDAAVLFRLVLESAPAGTAWHAVADEGDPVRDIATVIGRRLGLAVESVPEESFGPFGSIFALDQPSSSAHTRDALSWQPRHPSLLDDLENLRP